MELKNIEFIRVGDRILPKPEGCDYELINNKPYDLIWDDWNNQAYLVENGDLNLPDTLYELKEDAVFKKRVLNNFNKHNKSVGVMLAGTKGTGKTMLAKVIAKESNLPIIVVNSQFPANQLVGFFKQFNTPVCVIFDEVEKNFRTDKMLDFLDGVEKTTKKLVLMTCNEISNVSEYLQDRCSRIRYLRKYSVTDNLAFLPALLEKIQIKNSEEVGNFIKNNFLLPSIDNMTSFLNEVKDVEDEDLSLQDIVKYMNISTKYENDNIYDTNKESINDDENNDDYDEYF